MVSYHWSVASGHLSVVNDRLELCDVCLSDSLSFLTSLLITVSK